MTYKTRFKFLVLALAGCFTLSAPASVFASDISLPKYSKDAQLAAFHSAADLDLIGDDAYDDDPLTEILSINEVDVWGRIRSGFAIADLDNPLVENHMNYFARRPDYFQRTTQRGSKYLFHIVQELEKRNMPTELALLPFIESAYNPHARSIAKAEGLWQFIPSTGRHYDLAQNAFKDERRDIISSTEAALTYLQRLHDMFGDWQLALASYNWGEGSVMRAIKKAERAGKPITFNSISAYMPAETRNYVPKLQAVKNLITNPRRYGIDLPPVENQPYFVTIGKTRDIDVKVAARLAEMSLDDFRALNSQFGPYVIAGGNEVKILLPKENAEKFRKNLSLWTRPLSSWTAYQVTSPREKVEDIAARLNISPDVIRQANNIPSRSVLKFGSAILVPKTAGYDRDIAPELVENAKLAWERDLPATRLVTVPVRKPARLASIAKRYRVSVAELKSWNKINGDTVKKGTILKVHVPYRSAAATTRARTKAIRAADVRTSRNTMVSRVKVVMDAKNTASTKKGLVKSKNSRTARATLSKKTKSVKNQVSAQQTKTRKTAAKNRKKA
ncbi:transglycosylase SLT domain-containing protein [Oxalobacter aliiformigenes]|uniref:Transglycosylase SLT domain-containing protein n=1 Tax=Oxalobacter aliiformigenes TaxID=2946593 RepID=A0ABY7JLU1_9BURK|nr:transglycosylase SLT domain-containing protein [Oxalobacter aliiformigenes]WAV94045.1 transglycosylase SLT domain-containing protein [Oxalobacter aliiformigenes]WAV94457.1 transglycosylase SLT domain-containing protein [Oxalobacter aliiformigenes]WAV97738.1 transglycosylase SLT domain-containing protein [Oxalobacter aliiformigenes]